MEDKEYKELLKSGMFWEFYPELTGDWEKDKPHWGLILHQLQQYRKFLNEKDKIKENK